MAEWLTALHFSEPGWLWALLLCLPVALWLSLSLRVVPVSLRVVPLSHRVVPV